jgi:hypothetical protein
MSRSGVYNSADDSPTYLKSSVDLPLFHWQIGTDCLELCSVPLSSGEVFINVARDRTFAAECGVPEDDLEE